MKKICLALTLLGIMLLGGFIKYRNFTLVDDLSAKLTLFNKENPSINLYLHLDKSIYRPGDTIWFKAYILSRQFMPNRVINVRLVDQNKKLVVKGSFQVYDIRSHGDLCIPGDLRAGTYKLYAYTDKMENFNEHDVFTQSITVRNDVTNMLVAEASVEDTTKLVRGANVSVVAKVKDGSGWLKGISGQYQLLNEDTVLRTGKTRTNSAGEAIISFKYPMLADDKSLHFRAVFKRKDDFAEVKLNLHHEGNVAKVNAYPEGGHLLAGINNKMIAQVVDVKDYPVITNITLMDGSKSIAHAKTNNQGLAVLNFKPVYNTAYYFKISTVVKNSAHINLEQPIEKQGYSLALKKLNGNPLFIIKNRDEDGQATLILRTADRLVSSQQLVVPPGDSLSISLPLKSWDKDVLSAAIFNSAGTLMAERLFINKQADDYQVSIKPDMSSYSMRKKVNLAVSITDKEGKPVFSNLSVAVVEKNAIDATTYSTILNHYYFKGLTGDNMAVYINSKTDNDLDELLITKKWRSNDWDKVSDYTSHGPVKISPYTDGLAGFFTRSIGPSISYVNDTGLTSITLFNQNELMTIPVSQQYEFYIPASKLVASKGNEWKILYEDRFNTKYQIHLYSFDWIYETKVADAHLLDMSWIFNNYTYTAGKKESTVSNIGGVTNLKEVRIGAQVNANNEDYFNSECPDYVCSFGGFYCPRHKPGMLGSENNTSPVIGAIYPYQGFVVQYHGCGDYQMKSISIPDKFHAIDYNLDPNAEPNMGSTLFWAPNVNTGTDGKTTVSFFTSLKTTDYMVIVQGIDTKTLKPMYGATSFSVK